MDDEKPEECTGCGSETEELERVDLGRMGLPEYAQQVYHMEAIQWWCPYCVMIPITKREAMEPAFTMAAMLNVLERRLRA